MTGAVSAINSWVVRPGHFNETTTTLFSTGRDFKDVIEAIQTGLKWLPYFDVSQAKLDFARKASGELEPISQGLAFFSLFSDLNETRRSIGHYFASDDTDAGRKLFRNAMSAANSGSETAMFLDTINIIPLSQKMQNMASGVFWGSLGLLNLVDYFYQVGQIEHLNRGIEKEIDKDIKVVRQDELGLSYLKVLKNICTIALASIILISLVFAAAASYWLFSPAIQLGISTTWFVLHFITYYYASVINE